MIFEIFLKNPPRYLASPARLATLSCPRNMADSSFLTLVSVSVAQYLTKGHFFF